MSVPARRARFETTADLVEHELDSLSALDVLDAGERICPPAERSGSMLGATLLILVLMGGGAGVLSTQPDWLASLRARVEALSQPGRNTGAPPVVAPDTSSLAAAPPAAPVPTTPPIEVKVPVTPASAPAVPPHDAGVAAQAASGEPVETAGIDAPAEPLPPPRVDPSNPYQRRAAGVGLHPELSRVLLAKLSATDYRNAGYAIDTAIAKTADDADFVWPRQRKPEQALFRVHFVQGAAPQCRRYVVTVVKDGWSTTALPMERCGAGIGAGGAKTEAKPERAALSAR